MSLTINSLTKNNNNDEIINLTGNNKRKRTKNNPPIFLNEEISQSKQVNNYSTFLFDHNNLNSIMNLSTKPSKASIPCTEDDSAIPLNLCVKEGSNTSNGNNNGSSSSASRLDPSFYSNKINNPQPYNLVKNLPTSSHSNRVQNNIPSFNPFQALSQQQYLQQAQLLPPPQLQSQLQTLSQLQAQVPAQPQQKKRGRKPKSILNSEQIAGNDVPMNLLAAAANIANQQLPRKRGRPPTLSPPHNTLMHNLSSGKPAVSSNNTPSAFPNNYQLNCLLNPEFLNLALAAAANPLFNNCQNPFMLNKINQKDLLNASLLNWKNSLAEQANNKLPINKFPDPGSSIPKDNAQTLLQPFTSKSIEPSIFNKNSFAHKPTPNEKQLRIPLNHGYVTITFCLFIDNLFYFLITDLKDLLIFRDFQKMELSKAVLFILHLVERKSKIILI